VKVPKIGPAGVVALAAIAGAACVTVGVHVIAGPGFAWIAAGAFLLLFGAVLFRGLNG
jgi:hypothetical protein